MNDMPVGLMMTLAEQGPAMRRFAALPAEERDRIVSQARRAASPSRSFTVSMRERGLLNSTAPLLKKGSG